MMVPKINPNHKRIKPKVGNKTKITTKAREEVYRRAGRKCEICGRTNPWCFEVAHLVSAGQVGSGADPANLLLVCGPSVNSGTCHHFLDSTKEGREYKMKKHEELKRYYGR
ncbi:MULTISPECIES: hypothetical protein [unclassified Virgibacillus]|uniref:hypothetical protein n=1 Tax=unclassified Virgibacillus TaxID=2620237 RepID=UPI00090B65E7|nr:MULTISPECIES: hypothetical protein [unclassified Virgibacillus]API92681.1 hypothetical protein BKP57_13225 [Virgibacillus sp. 6R]MBS7428175.1 hypothetical protein [Virgibacillus sp. 19R1-5]